MLFRVPSQGFRNALLTACRPRPSPLHAHHRLCPHALSLSSSPIQPPEIKQSSREAEIESYIAEIKAEIAKANVEMKAALAAKDRVHSADIRKGMNILYQSLENERQRLENERQRLENERQHQRLLEAASASTALAQDAVAVSVIDESRKKRWKELNNVLDIHNKSREGTSGQRSTAYSYINWNQVKDFFPIDKGVVGSTGSAELPEDKLAALHQYMGFATTCLRLVTEGKEAKRIHFIAPVVIMVCAHFNGDVELLVEEDVNGNRVHAHGHFEFVMKRGGKRLCILEAKRDDFDQGKVQSLVGCEVLCDVEELSVTYAIATNFIEWHFFQVESDKVTRQIISVQLDAQDRPSMETLKLVANKIIAILD